MPNYTIAVDEYADIVGMDKSSPHYEQEKKNLINAVTTWDNIIYNIYKGNASETKKLYEELNLYKKYYITIGPLKKQKYYTQKEQYIFIASANDAYLEKGVSYLQLLRQIKSQLYDGISIPSVALYDRLKYWDPEKKRKDISSKIKAIEASWGSAQKWSESNEERLKPQPWEGLGAGSGLKGGQRFRHFVENNCHRLGGFVRGNKWFSGAGSTPNMADSPLTQQQNALPFIEINTIPPALYTENEETSSNAHTGGAKAVAHLPAPEEFPASGQLTAPALVPSGKTALPPQGNSMPQKVVGQRVYYKQNPKVEEWVKNNAKGKCECCNMAAPFLSLDGEPYLEIHHVIWRCNQGHDTTWNTVAVCPNCHRALHNSVKRDELRENLYKKIERLKNYSHY